MHSVFYQIISHLPEMEGITLTEDQENAVSRFLAFFQSDEGRDMMLLTGSAGTGKTLLIHFFTTFLKKMKWKVILLAPTGRAAKVITKRTGKPAYTIHHHVFSVGENLQGNPYFTLKENKEKSRVVYIVDEASMIGDKGDDSVRTGLLQSLLNYVYQNDENRKLILIGDPIQLPPVGHTDSPALEPRILRETFDLNVFHAHLQEVKRQEIDSLVLDNAVQIREAYTSGEEKPELSIQYGRDVQQLDNAYDALETYSGYYQEGNIDRVVFITYSNNKAMQVNMAIRHKLFETQAALIPGDLIMVVKNNYSWGTEHFPFLANGEMGVVVEVFPETKEEKYGLNFMNVSLGFEDAFGEQKLIECKVVLDLLQNKAAQLSNDHIYRIWQERSMLYVDLPKTEARKALAQDPYLHALQIKYGYAITGHKAQGGQWENVIVAFEPDYGGDIYAYIRWTYTVFTRAESRAFLLGCPF
ncbi:MAG: AAA family ATPase [Bacteroidia bacterium]|nr:AAA family ATPase [Bacteroidia bacterium]